MTSKGPDRVHSPFVFNLYYYHLKKKSEYYCFDSIDNLFLSIAKDQNTIQALDKGAGTVHHSVNREIGKLSRTSSVSKKYGEILFKLVNHTQPKHILELGTAFGKSTAYLAAANTKAQVTSVDADHTIQNIAFENLKKLTLQNVSLVNAEIDEFLNQLQDKQQFDFVYIDANHTYQATTRYFHLLLSHLSPQAVVVFDDIYWSREMTKAWKEISSHPQSTVSVDLYQFGIVFFGKQQAKEYFKLRL